MSEGRPEGVVTLSDEEKRRRRVRSMVIGWGLAALALLFFLVTLVRMGAQVVNRPL